MGLDPSRHHRSEQPNSLQHRCEQMAAVLVNAGWVVPALETDRHGQLQTRWWPLPAAAASKRGKTAPAGGGAGLNLTGLVRIEWQAVLGDRPLSAAELASLERAAALKRPRRSRARRRAQTFVTSHTRSTGSPGFGLSPSRS